MLTKEDKKWIVGAIQLVVQPMLDSTLDSAFKVQKQWIETFVTEAVRKEIEELARMVAKGFEACATKEELWAVENRLAGVEGRLGVVEERVTGVEERLVGTENGLIGVKHHLGSLESRLENIETKMVTKEYLDERLEIKKEKEDEVHKQLKFLNVTLVEELRRKKIIGPKRANTILSMQPFPQKLT